MSRREWKKDDREEVRANVVELVARTNSIKPRVQASIDGDWILIHANGVEDTRFRWWVGLEVPGVIEPFAGNWTSIPGRVAQVRTSILLALIGEAS